MDPTPLINTFVGATEAVIVFATENYFPTFWELEICVTIDGKNRPVTVRSAAHGHSRICVETKTDLIYTGPDTIAAITHDGAERKVLLDVDEEDIVKGIIKAVHVLPEACTKLSQSAQQNFAEWCPSVWEAHDAMKNGGPSFKLMALFTALQDHVDAQFSVVYTKDK